MFEKLAELIVDSPLNQWIQAKYWLWPILEITHFLGLTLLLGGLIIIDLRMIGFFRNIDHKTTHRLIPLVALGFILNLITGVLFFYGDPMRYSINIAFQIKMLLVLIAGCNAAVYHFKIDPLLGAINNNDSSPLAISIVAAISLGTWTGVLLLGRLIPYIGTG